jgi:hypothetical protein
MQHTIGAFLTVEHTSSNTCRGIEGRKLVKKLYIGLLLLLPLSRLKRQYTVRRVRMMHRKLLAHTHFKSQDYVKISRIDAIP